MSAIEYRCGQYFDTLGRAVQQLSFTRKETSLTGGLVSGAMGLANQSAKTNTAALFGFATSSMDAYQEAFLYTPDIDLMRRLVMAALAANGKNFTQQNDEKEIAYGQVVSFLKLHESICISCPAMCCRISPMASWLTGPLSSVSAQGPRGDRFPDY